MSMIRQIKEETVRNKRKKKAEGRRQRSEPVLRVKRIEKMIIAKEKIPLKKHIIKSSQKMNATKINQPNISANEASNDTKRDNRKKNAKKWRKRK